MRSALCWTISWLKGHYMPTHTVPLKLVEGHILICTQMPPTEGPCQSFQSSICFNGFDVQRDIDPAGNRCLLHA